LQRGEQIGSGSSFCAGCKYLYNNLKNKALATPKHLKAEKYYLWNNVKIYFEKIIFSY